MDEDGNLRILLLSDVHFGSPEPGSNIYRTRIFLTLYQSIKEITSEFGHPHLIIFAGDLAFGKIITNTGKGNTFKDQYEIAKNFILTLYEELGITLKEVPFVCVPGNHDVDRTNLNNPYVQWVHGLDNKDVLNTEISNESEVWKYFLSLQNEWKNFYKNLSSDFKNPPLFIDKYNASITELSFQEKTVKIIGINSSWSVLNDDHYGKVVFSELQIIDLLNRVKEQDFVIIVSHYPPKASIEFEQKFLEQTIQSRSNVFIHGHHHSFWFDDLSKHLSISCGSLYESSDSCNSYAFLILNLKGQHSSLIVKKYTNDGSGGWIPHHIPNRTEENGSAIINSTLDAYVPKYQPAKKMGVRPGSKVPMPRPKRSNLAKSFSSSLSFSDFIKILEQNFKFRWEEKNLSKEKDVTIYWPVRLHRPTPIHAVQCLTAAGFSKLGARIILFVDDLGNTENTFENLSTSFSKWFTKVDGDFSRVDSVLCSKTISNSVRVWKLIQSWYKNDKVNIEEAFSVAKLLNFDNFNSIQEKADAFSELREKKPRKLMTPPIVWAGLEKTIKEYQNTQVITLGGYDENKLWSIWRERIKLPQKTLAKCVGHLYIPELYSSLSTKSQPLDMADPLQNMNWTAKEDIDRAFEQELSTMNLSPNERIDFENWNRLPSWMVLEACLLPKYIKSGKTSNSSILYDITKYSDMKKLNVNQDNIENLIMEIEKWLM